MLTTVNRTRLDLADTRTGRNVTPHYQRAFDLLTTRRAQAAFRIADEPAADRQRYGSTTFGQSLLLSRRLVEAGVRFVNVHWPNVSGGRNWDTHRNGFNRLRNDLLPSLDLSLSALLEDLDDRGLLERTLVAVMGGELYESEVKEVLAFRQTGFQAMAGMGTHCSSFRVATSHSTASTVTAPQMNRSG